MVLNAYHVGRSMYLSMPRSAALLCALAFSVTAPLQAQTLAAGKTAVTAAENAAVTEANAGEAYLAAWTLWQEAGKLAARQNYNEAIKRANRAEKMMARIVKDCPNWKKNFMANRRKTLQADIENYRKKAKEAPIPTGRQPGKPVATVVELPTGIAPAPAGTGTYRPADLPDYNSVTDKDMYNALATAQEECRKMAAAYKELNSKFTAVQQELTEARLTQQMYKERYDELQERIAGERTASNTVVDRLTQQLSEMEARYRASEQARKEAEARVVELEKNLADTQAELERVTRERDALKAENEQLRAIVELNSPEKTKALLDQNLSLDQRLKAAQARIAELEAQQAGSDDQQNVLAQQLSEARSEADRLRDEMSGIYDENIGYRRRISELSERLTNLEAELEVAAGRPTADPAMAEENKLLREVIAKQKRTIAMQEEGRKLLIETYKQIKNQDPETLSALQKLDEESSLDLTDAERRIMDAVKGTEHGEKEAAHAVREGLEVEALATAAAKAFAKGRYTAAEQLYRTLYESQPSHVAGLVNLGTILLYRNKCEEAVEYLQRASRLAPDLAISYYLTGINLYRLDRMEEARVMFARTAELDPGNAEAFFYLANIEGISGEYENALKHFAAAIKLKPALGDAHYNMARLYAELQKIPDAARAYDRAVQNGAEPDPEFEEFLRSHPDNAKKPGEDLLETVKPEDESAALRAADPEMDQIIRVRDNDALPSDAEQPQEGETAAPAGERPVEVNVDGPSFLDLMSKVQKEIHAAPTASPAGNVHETDAKRFGTVRVRTGRGRHRTTVKLRLKRPEPKRLRKRGEELK